MGSFMSLLLAPLAALLSLVPLPLPLAAGVEVEEEEEALSLSELLRRLGEPQEVPEDLWPRVLRRLQQAPEEAACYCHTVDPSPLLQCLTASQTEEVPLEVIRAFLEAYEDAIFSSDAEGVTPLLAAAQREMEATNVLLQANTCAAQQPDKKGRLPLHFVRADVSLAESLFKAHPSAVTAQDHEGRLPLHFCCALTRTEAEAENRSDDSRIGNQLRVPVPEVASLLLQVGAGTTLELQPDKAGITPLDLLFQSLSSLLERKANSSDIEKLWDILTLFVQSVSISTAPMTPFLHALVSLRCPAEVMKEALRRFPAQAVERDAQGRTPLLLAVELLDSNSNASSAQAQAVVCELLKTNPRAARMTDKEGRLAIDVLTEKPYNEQVYDLIVQAEPRAIDTRDLKNKQHPFLTAAMAGNSDGVYHLLRAKPHVIRYFLNEC